MSVAVAARFAGGTIEVDDGHLTDDPSQGVVILDIAGFAFPMFPDEARALASALTTTAEAAENHKPLRRRPETDDALRELDD